MYANSFPVDRNNLDGQSGASAVPAEWPELSWKATQGLAYLDPEPETGTAFLFRYRGQFVITDESGDLTDCGDGSHESPFGGPRLVADSESEIQNFFEAVWSDLCNDCGLDPEKSFSDQEDFI